MLAAVIFGDRGVGTRDFENTGPARETSNEKRESIAFRRLIRHSDYYRQENVAFDVV